MRKLFPFGFGIHHAGMLRSDRNLSERLFDEGLIKVLSAQQRWHGASTPQALSLLKGHRSTILKRVV